MGMHRSKATFPFACRRPVTNCGALFTCLLFRDNIFATYMTSLSSKEIAYSNFIQVIRSKTAMGFVPNYSAGGTKVRGCIATLCPSARIH